MSTSEKSDIPATAQGHTPAPVQGLSKGAVFLAKTMPHGSIAHGSKGRVKF